MMHQLSEFFYKELVEVLKKVGEKINRERRNRLYDYYFRIYLLLIEIQNCNEDFLYELKLAKRTKYRSHLIDAFRAIEVIEVLHRRIFSIVGENFNRDSIMSLLRADQYTTYKLLSQFTGEKLQRIYFWKRTLQQLSSIAKNTIDDLSKQLLEKELLNLHITEIEVIPFDVDVLSKEYEFLRGIISYDIKRTDVLLDESYIEKQIFHTEKTIRDFNRIIGEFNTLVKGQMDINQLMGRYKHLKH